MISPVSDFVDIFLLFLPLLHCLGFGCSKIMKIPKFVAVDMNAHFFFSPKTSQIIAEIIMYRARTRKPTERLRQHSLSCTLDCMTWYVLVLEKFSELPCNEYHFKVLAADYDFQYV